MTIKQPIFTVLMGLMATSLTHSAARSEDFYSGKTIEIIVGVPAGGGLDSYARLLARHMGDHIPGRPRFVVMNMPGAGSLKAVNYLANIAKPDGLTIGTFLGHVVWNQVYNRPGVQFDARKLRWLGIPAVRTGACVLTRASGIDSIDKWKSSPAPVTLGAVGLGTESNNTGRILRDILKLPVKIVPGYAGSQQIKLAVENGEVNGVCLQWEALTATWRSTLSSGQVVPVLQFRQTPHPELPNVPLATSLAKTDEDRQLMSAGVESSNAITTSYALPPQTPEDRVAILRKAFMATLSDPAVQAEANQMYLDTAPVSGEDMQKMIEDLFTLNPSVHEKLRNILFAE